MNKSKNKGVVVVIPGYGMTSLSAPIVKLHAAIKYAGYRVFDYKVSWKSPLSKQVRNLPKDSILIGFSLGAVLAYLVAKKYGCKKVIMASMTPVQEYSQTLWMREVYEKDMRKKDAELCAKDITSIKIQPDKLTCEHIVLAGEQEDSAKVWKPDFLVPKTTHTINRSYINAIIKTLS